MAYTRQCKTDMFNSIDNSSIPNNTKSLVWSILRASKG